MEHLRHRKRIIKRGDRLITNRSHFTSIGISFAIIASLCLNYAFITMTKNCFSSAMVFIVEEGVLTKSQTGTITSVFFLIYGFLQVLAGILADKWHPERLIFIGFMGAGIANLVIFFNQSYLVMLSAWVFNALTQFPVWPSTFKIVSSMTSPKIRKKGIFIMSFSSSIGQIMGYVVAAFVSHWVYNFLVSAVGLFAFAFLWAGLWFIAKKTPMEENEHIEPTVPHPEEHKDVNIVKLMFRSGMAFLVVVNFISSSFTLGIKTFTPTIIRESYTNITSSFATIISLVVVVVSMLGLYFAKLWYPKPFKSEMTALLVMLSAALIPCGALLLIGKVNYWLMTIAMAVLMLLLSAKGLYVSFMQASFNKWGKSATVVGIMNFAASFGVMFANFAFTRIADNFGWIVTLFVCFLLLLLAVVLSLIALPKWNKFKKEELEGEN